MDDITHFQEAGIDPALGEFFELIDILIGGHNREALVGIAGVDEIVEDFEFPFGVALDPEIVDDEKGNGAQVFEDLDGLPVYGATFVECVSNFLEAFGQGDELAGTDKMKDEFVEGDIGEIGFSVSWIAPQIKPLVWFQGGVCPGRRPVGTFAVLDGIDQGVEAHLEFIGTGNGLTVFVVLPEVMEVFVAKWGRDTGVFQVAIDTSNFYSVEAAGAPGGFFCLVVEDHKRRFAAALAVGLDILREFDFAM